MLKLNSTAKFDRDLKRCIKQGRNIALLWDVVNILRFPAALPLKNRDHALVGNHAGKRECHITPDWILIYRIQSAELYLLRTGSHADVLGM